MSATVRIAIEDIDAAIADYESIKLYSALTPDDAFGTLVTTIPLVADTYEYSYEHSAGGSSFWYRFTLYHSTGPQESEQSPPFQAGVTLSWLRMEAAIRAKAGFAGTATGGSSTTLVDSVLRDNGVDENYLASAWVYRPDATDATDKLRRLAEQPFNATTGALLPIREYTVPPSSGEAYHVFNLMPPVDQAGWAYSWTRAVRDGLDRIRFVDLLVLGAGDGTTTRFSLDTHSNRIGERHIQRVLLRTEDSTGRLTERDAGKHGLYWDVVENSPDTLSLELSAAPTTQELVVVEALSKDSALYRDDDTTLVPPERAVVAGAWFALRRMNMGGRYADEIANLAQEFNDLEYEHAAPTYVRLV